jgi:adenylate cyclase
MLRLRTLGGLALEGESGPLLGGAAQRRCVALLALLALSRDRGISRDKILPYLWPESDEHHARHALSQLLYALRQHPPHRDLVTGAADLRLNPEVVASDLSQFAAALARDDLEGAVAVYGGPFLDGFHLAAAPEFERMVEKERARLQGQIAAALESLARRAATRGECSAAVEWWQRLLELDPYSSRVVLELMRALVAGGDRAAAIHQAEEYKKRTREELEVPPDPGVVALADELRRGPTAPRQSEPTVATVAVLPFVNVSPDPEGEYFADGLAEELINALARVKGLRVASRMSSFTFKGASVDAREVGARLNVGAIVEGSARTAGDRVRISARLVSTANGYEIWSGAYERNLSGLFAAQDELARAIVAQLAETLVGRHPIPLVTEKTGSLPAYLGYLRGLHHLGKRTPEGIVRAVESLEEVIAGDPAFARAYAALGVAYMLTLDADYRALPYTVAVPKGEAAARKALQLDESLAEPHAVLGWMHQFHDYDPVAAEREFRLAIETEPHSAFAHFWYGIYLTAMGRADESITALQRALELDPLFPRISLDLGEAYWLARRYEAALAQYRLTAEMTPWFWLASFVLGQALALRGQIDEARAVGHEFSASWPESYRLMLNALTEGLSGRVEEAQRLIQRIDNLATTQFFPARVAKVAAALGDVERCLTFLSRAVDEKIAVWFGNDPVIVDCLGADPRFRKLRQRMGLGPLRTHEGKAE